MILLWLLAATAQPSIPFALIENKSPLTVGKPAPGTWDLAVASRAEQGAMDVEIYQQSTAHVVAEKRGKQLLWTVTTVPQGITAQSAFGPVERDQLQKLDVTTTVRYETSADGTLSELALDGGLPELQGVLGGFASQLRIQPPPKRTPVGGSWKEELDIALPIETEDVRGRMLLTATTKHTFVGWTKRDQGKAAVIATESELLLRGGALMGTHATRMGGVANTSAVLLLDAETGRMLWMAQTSEVSVAVGDSGKPTTVRTHHVVGDTSSAE